MKLLWSLAAAMLLAAPAWPQAAQRADPALLAAIRSIRAIDNHAHPPALPTQGVADTDYDALPCPPGDPTPPTLVSRLDNPAFLEAWKDLFQYPYNDRAPAHVRVLLAAKARVRQAQGDHYPAWVLDRLGIETELANRVAMGPGLTAPRFRWVPFADPLLLPVSTEALAALNPDRQYFFTREHLLLQRYLAALHLDHVPPTLSAYLAQVVMPTLARQQAAGAVAIKFEAAYLRPLDFHRPDPARAAAIYARYAQAGVPDAADSYILQDAIFHAIALAAGRRGLPVHFHTGFGCGSYFDLAGANPLLLEEVFNDPSLRGTNFVMLHGGVGPYAKIVASLLAKPNVYTDYSGQTWALPTAAVAQVVRYWLEWYPAKVMFGTDASPGPLGQDWEETAWQTSHSVRDALAIALTGMLRDGEVTRARALALARMVLRGNALQLYRWPDR